MPDNAGVREKRKLAVGYPSVRPSCLPRTTRPPMAYGRRAAEQVARVGESSSSKQFANARCRNPLAMSMHRSDLAGHKAMLLTERMQQADVAATPMAEAKLRADPDFARTQATDQDQAHKIVRAHLRQSVVETNQAHAVGAELIQAFDLGARQGQTRWRHSRRKELARQRLKAHRHCRHTAGARARHGVPHQHPMPQVQAIESADADHASVREQRPAFKISKQPAHSSIQTDAGLPTDPRCYITHKYSRACQAARTHCQG